MPITTNRHWREFVYRHDVPKAILAREFDYQDPEETIDGFFRYRGHWYHLGQFTRNAPEGWHGSLADSMFSGVVIRLSSDGERFQVGTWIA